MRYTVPLEVKVGSVVTVEAKDEQTALKVAVQQWMAQMCSAGYRVNPAHICAGAVKESTQPLGIKVQ